MSYLIPRLDPHDLDLSAEKESLLALDISKSIADHLVKHPDATFTPAYFLSFAQRAWHIDAKRAEDVSTILAVVKTRDKRPQIVGVFLKSRDFDEFHDDPYEKGRHSIFLRPAEESLWNRYVGLFLPEVKPGARNPIHYYEQE